VPYIPTDPQYESTTVEIKRTFVVKVATMKITDDLMEAMTCKSTLFVVNKDEWYTKEGHAKSMKNALYVQQCSKKHLSG